MTDLRYPIGPFTDHARDRTTAVERAGLMDEIAAAPARLRAAVAGLDDAQLDTPYRENGWTVRQVVHHVIDSHVNAYVRFRWALTEDGPVIKPYDEKEWALLPDAMTSPVGGCRWICWMRSIDAGSSSSGRWSPRTSSARWTNPDLGELSVDVLLQHYAWHGKHHVAHIMSLRGREGW